MPSSVGQTGFGRYLNIASLPAAKGAALPPMQLSMLKRFGVSSARVASSWALGGARAPTRRKRHVAVMNLTREAAVEPPSERAAVESTRLPCDLASVAK
jgi:hypothetical protein